MLISSCGPLLLGREERGKGWDHLHINKVRKRLFWYVPMRTRNSAGSYDFECFCFPSSLALLLGLPANEDFPTQLRILLWSNLLASYSYFSPHNVRHSRRRAWTTCFWIMQMNGSLPRRFSRTLTHTSVDCENWGWSESRKRVVAPFHRRFPKRAHSEMARGRRRSGSKTSSKHFVCLRLMNRMRVNININIFADIIGKGAGEESNWIKREALKAGESSRVRRAEKWKRSYDDSISCDEDMVRFRLPAQLISWCDIELFLMNSLWCNLNCFPLSACRRMFSDLCDEMNSGNLIW